MEVWTTSRNMFKCTLVTVSGKFPVYIPIQDSLVGNPRPYVYCIGLGRVNKEACCLQSIHSGMTYIVGHNYPSGGGLQLIAWGKYTLCNERQE